VRSQALEFFRNELQQQVPEGYALNDDSVTLGEAEVIAEAPDGVQYRVGATGVANALFDAGAESQLVENLAGTSREDAEASVGGISQFASWEISQSPGWWPEGMPQAADRITVEVNQAPLPEAASTPEPATTPVADDGQ
jgi:hypothetical protein